MAELTSAFIRYETTHNVSFVNWDHVGYGWVKGISEFQDSNLESLRELWIGTTLYLDYLSEKAPDTVMDGFDPRYRREASNSEIIDVIEQIRAGNLDPKEWINFRQTIDPIELPGTGYVFSFSFDDGTFEEWLEQKAATLQIASSSGGFVSGSELGEMLEEEMSQNRDDETDRSDSA